MQKDLQSYVKVYNNFFDKEFCQETIDQLKSAEFHMHQFYNSQNNTTESYEKELSVSWSNIPNKDLITTNIWNGINQYIGGLGFTWNNGWVGYSPVRFNKYDVNTQMAEHCDHIHDMFDGQRKGIPILSIVGVMNEDYQGGEFIMWQDTEIELHTGDLMIFPSNFLYPHKVQEISQGTRYSVVSWTW